MDIPFIDLKTQFMRIEGKVRSGIDKVFEHGQFIMGPEVFELERELAKFAGVKRAVTCSSGTDALLMTLMARNIGPGDAVFTTPFTFFATAEVISLLGATPVFVDIDAPTFNISSVELEKKIDWVKKDNKLKPACVIPVDLFGLPADYDEIDVVAKENGLFVLEDAAQSFGAEYKGRKAGSLGDAAALSFFPAKPLGCYGDGGAVLTNDNDLADELESVRVHGQGVDKYNNRRIGLNARLDTIQAAAMLPKLEIFPEELKDRDRVADRYAKGLEGCVETPGTPDQCKSAWAQYSVISDKRNQIRAALKAGGVPTAVYYPAPLHLQKAFSSLGHKKGDFPVSESVADNIFSLPMSPYLTDEQQDKIIHIIKRSTT
jgi:dTDP-4-amino-4,6-dideoxygalactose transaminase